MKSVQKQLFLQMERSSPGPGAGIQATLEPPVPSLSYFEHPFLYLKRPDRSGAKHRVSTQPLGLVFIRFPDSIIAIPGSLVHVFVDLASGAITRVHSHPTVLRPG